MATCLIIDDNEGVCDALSLLLELNGIDSLVADNPAAGLAMARDNSVDLVIQDMNFTEDTTSGEEGEQLFRQLRAEHADMPIILLTAWTHLEQAVDLVKSGAADYLSKPWDDDKLITTVNNLLALGRARCSIRQASEAHRDACRALGEKFDLCGTVFASQAMLACLTLATRVARADVPVLITGPNGAGKQHIAEVIQANSAVRDGPFVTVNAGALPEHLIEAELFGAEAGAYTGASKARAGRFELADGGTLFLDEIGNLPPDGQMKLLRVLQTGEFERLGSAKTRRVQVRVVSATNADLNEAVKEGIFREDLLYRINVIQIDVPPLAERRDDILPLAEHFLRDSSFGLSREGKEALRGHSWPGNVRELSNRIQRAQLLTDGPINAVDLDLPAISRNVDAPDAAAIVESMRRHDGVIARVAKELNLSRQALYRRMDKLKIAR